MAFSVLVFESKLNLGSIVSFATNELSAAAMVVSDVAAPLLFEAGRFVRGRSSLNNENAKPDPRRGRRWRGSATMPRNDYIGSKRSTPTRSS
jgi:hypothetical protein